MATTPNDEPGNEARHTGDRIGYPHGETDGNEYSSATLSEGVVVTYNGTNVVEVTGDNSDDVTGILFTLPVEGQSRRGGPYIRGDRDATVAVRGQYVADLSAYAGGGATIAEGGSLGANGEIHVKEAIDAGNNIYEVVLR